MKERPILFSTPMIQAILAGRKTMTRRVVKPQPDGNMMPNQLKDDGFFRPEHIGKWLWETKDGEHLKFCPYGSIGDRLWVRETWNHSYNSDIDIIWKSDFVYRADGDHVCPKWKPSIHMPRTASRITLEITDVRVERLREISEWDAMIEGAELLNHYGKISYGLPRTYREAFERLWESINGPGSWEQNPHVWVITFKRIEP